MSPIQVSQKSNEKLVYPKLREKRQIQKPKFKLGHLVRTVDTAKVFNKGDSTNYNYDLYTITEIIQDTVWSYNIIYLPERYNEQL